MDENAPTKNSTVMTIGDTVFIVDIEFSSSARETPYEKIKRLILEDVEFSRHKVSKDTIAN